MLIAQITDTHIKPDGVHRGGRDDGGRARGPG